MNALLKKLFEQKFVNENPACRDNVALLGESLIYSLGIDMKNPEAPADEKAGYDKAADFLSKVCTTFSNPTHMVRIAPFANAYLGNEVFNRALGVVLERAKTHPKEQSFLDDVFTGAALVRPDKRAKFLDSVRSAKDISDEMFGLGMLISHADPEANFTTPDEFPEQFRNPDISRATSLLGRLVELGVFVPGKGFLPEYNRLSERMGGLDYLGKEASQEHALIIGRERFPDLRGVDLDFELTPEHDARPRNTGENPALVIINSDLEPSAVKKLYPASTLLYASTNPAMKKNIAALLGKNIEMLVDGNDDFSRLLSKHIQFVREGRRKGAVDFTEILNAGVAEAKNLALAGNEYFYDLRDQFAEMGRADIIDKMVAAEKIRLPKRTNSRLVMLLSSKPEDLLEYFDGATEKILRHYKRLPNADETDAPFVIITNQPYKETEIRSKFPSATVLYFARDGREEGAIIDANGTETFVVNAESMRKLGEQRERQVARDYLMTRRQLGSEVVRMFFNPIAESRGRGITDMNDIAKDISQKIKTLRDKIMFEPNLDDYYDAARQYWNLQEKYRVVPIIAQMLDGVLMQTCPTGGCLKMTKEPHGGCGANYGRLLINLAIDFRKQIGEENYAAELARYHGGKTRMPWYTREYDYVTVFQNPAKTHPTAKNNQPQKPKFDMTF